MYQLDTVIRRWQEIKDREREWRNLWARKWAAEHKLSKMSQEELKEFYRKQRPKESSLFSGLPGAISLFPEEQLENDVVYLAEGELDALCAISHGLSAMTVTRGAGSWKEKWTPLFKEKK